MVISGTVYLVMVVPRRSDWTQPETLSKHRHTLKKGDVAISALAGHALETGHPVDLSKAEVIDYHPFTTSRCLLESWHI